MAKRVTKVKCVVKGVMCRGAMERLQAGCVVSLFRAGCSELAGDIPVLVADARVWKLVRRKPKGAGRGKGV